VSDDQGKWTIVGCSFVGCDLPGSETPTDRPVILGDSKNGNVAWPVGWSAAQRRDWRMMMDMPGAEWPENYPGHERR